MAKKRVKVSLKKQLEEAERKGRKEGMAALLAVLPTSNIHAEDLQKYEFSDSYSGYRSISAAARIDAAMINAAEKNQVELVAFLLEAGAHANSRDEEGNPVLVDAVREGHIELVKTLLKAGADPNLTGEDELGDDYEGQHPTPLACALEEGQIEIAEVLLAAGADVHQGYTPGLGPGWIVNYDAEGDYVEITKAFLAAGAYIGPDEDLWTPLMPAAVYGKTASAALLIKAGCDINAQDKSGESVLMMVAKNGEDGDLDTIRLLLNSGAKINHKDEEGQTALMGAAKAGRSEVVRLLLAAGADVFSRAHSVPERMLETTTQAVNAFDLATDEAVKEIIKFEMHWRIAAALSVLPSMPVDVRQKIIQLYTEGASSAPVS